MLGAAETARSPTRPQKMARPNTYHTSASRELLGSWSCSEHAHLAVRCSKHVGANNNSKPPLPPVKLQCSRVCLMGGRDSHSHRQRSRQKKGSDGALTITEDAKLSGCQRSSVWTLLSPVPSNVWRHAEAGCAYTNTVCVALAPSMAKDSHVQGILLSRWPSPTRHVPSAWLISAK